MCCKCKCNSEEESILDKSWNEITDEQQSRFRNTAEGTPFTAWGIFESMKAQQRRLSRRNSKSGTYGPADGGRSTYGY